MRTFLSLALALLGCSGLDAQQELDLAGPREIRVDSLGPVVPPAVALADGGEVDGLAWEVEAVDVARVDGERVVAVGPGRTVVIGTWEGQTVEWTLVVDPALQLRFVEPPFEVGVGERRDLAVEARLGDQVLPSAEVVLASNEPEVLRVSGGAIVGVAPGIAYVTATSGRSQAMLEVAVHP